ncbi:MAG: PIN domain-containing protein [Burkholderiales bacterium]|nr:PIN domain-containing protein [Burkholderiales bacterium]
MTERVFVDTNVFVYGRDTRDPGKQSRAAAWLEYLWREQAGRTSVQALSEYYVTVTRKLAPGLTPAEAWDDVRSLFAWRPCPVDVSLLERGREIGSRYKLAWWDGLIVAAAEAQDCNLLLSEDLQDGGVYGSVTVRSPFALEVNEGAARYATAATAASRHPLRGRPRRAPAATLRRP